MPAPKILMLGWEFPPRVTGGLGVACQGLVEALGDQVDLQFWMPEGEAETMDGNVIPVSLSPYDEALYSGDLISRVADFTEQVVSDAQKLKFDIVHAHDWMTVPAALEIKRAMGKPMVLHLHSTECDRVGPGVRNLVYNIERSGMQIADRVVLVSQMMADVCHDEYAIPPGRLDVVHNGVKSVKTWRASSGRPKVLFVGRLTHQKSPDDFIRMAARVASRIPNVEFVMVGEGAMMDELRALSSDLGLGDRLRFTGFINQSRLAAEFATASLLVMTSRSDPFGLVALEAAQFEVPSILTNRCGVAEVLPSAWQVPVGGHQEMANAVEHLLRSESMRKLRGKQAKQEAAYATWDLVAQKVFRIYTDLMTK